MNLLKEDDIGTDGADRLAELMEDEPAIQRAEAFVGIDGENAQGRRSIRHGRPAIQAARRPRVALRGVVRFDPVVDPLALEPATSFAFVPAVFVPLAFVPPAFASVDLVPVDLVPVD
ncbi:MAG: hypothetical protein ABWZ78_04975, partial [Burkholderiaceae bacterium]